MNMSYYYTYYLGFMDKRTKKVYPLGPYDLHGRYHPVFSRSRSFASDLHERFCPLSCERVSAKLRKVFEYKEYGIGDTVMPSIKYALLDELPNGSFVKRGYFLTEEIEQYLKDYAKEEDIDADEYFHVNIPVELYAERLKNEIALGPPPAKQDCEGELLEQYSVRDFALFVYPDYTSEEYEAHLLRQAAKPYMYSVQELRNGAEVVVLETEG